MEMCHLKTSQNLSRIGFESLERVKLAIPLIVELGGHVVEGIVNTFVLRPS